MGKEDFINGSILEFKLPFDFGIGYCKILDFRHIRTFDGVLVKVFDYVVKRPINDIAILREKDWLFGARRMFALPGTRGKGAWKMKGVLIAADDNIIPDFKYTIKEPLLLENESKAGPWFVVRNIRESSKNPYSYDNVKHLEDTVVNSRIGIEIRTAMEYCRQNNMDIKEYFDLNDTINNRIYKQMISIPIYKTIPKKNRGKAIE